MGVSIPIVWSTSFIFVKMLLPAIGPLSIAGVRFFLAFLVLVPLFTRSLRVALALPARTWIRLIVIGICGFSIGNAALIWSLKYLPATTLSLLLSFVPLIVLGMSLVWLRERPTRVQLIGVVLAIGGGFLYFHSDLSTFHLIGFLFAIGGFFALSIYGVLARELARDRLAETWVRTYVPMGIGGGLLIIPAFLFEGIPVISARTAVLMLLLALVPTAIGHLLYNKMLERFTALEMNVLLNLIPLGTALFAWLMLGEIITIRQLLGILVVIAGVITVQMGRRKPLPNA
jgi:drug/metabolite transporter (DMT)-like permease